jgi:hypothetical protein
MYFKSLRNCHLFGISCGSNNTQLNYLIDEADVNKKNPDLVISILHDFFEKRQNFKPQTSTPGGQLCGSEQEQCSHAILFFGEFYKTLIQILRSLS